MMIWTGTTPSYASNYRESRFKISFLLLHAMTRECNFGSSASIMVRDQLSSGITAQHVRWRLLQQGPTLTLQQAIQVAKKEERTEHDLHNFADAQVENV
ncbi:hypothetical protein HPB50_012568 [Hyalomma asiaticum]|uniref:Uncharacterized protein n=1 Tax=Hyalomma asiaticum TaxID=266040 RepID=A0ACB7RLU1_HYAAI|nr:hypothetical protein HPB50_012568 [Hyalomma asiaticum]